MKELMETVGITAITIFLPFNVFYDHCTYSPTSRKRIHTGPRVSVRLREVSAYGRVKKKCNRGHIMHQNKYVKALRPLVTVLSTRGLLDVAFLLYIHTYIIYLVKQVGD